MRWAKQMLVDCGFYPEPPYKTHQVFVTAANADGTRIKAIWKSPDLVNWRIVGDGGESSVAIAGPRNSEELLALKVVIGIPEDGIEIDD